MAPKTPRKAEVEAEAVAVGDAVSSFLQPLLGSTPVEHKRTTSLLMVSILLLACFVGAWLPGDNAMLVTRDTAQERGGKGEEETGEKGRVFSGGSKDPRSFLLLFSLTGHCSFFVLLLESACSPLIE